ncbi:MAG TPA: SIMPL domain-containing protein [Candidatus Saccharimonadales bacterium]|nr:SIMPL domain-containing protein [Candidatus Saccharimonadales bacterium]
MALSSDSKLVIKISALSAIFTVILLVLINYFVNHTWALGGGGTSKNPPITVTGSGMVSAQPDQSSVSFTVTKTANTLKDAQNQANTFTNKMVSDLQKIGVEKKDIQTSNYNSYPNYQEQSSGPNVYMPINKPQSQTIQDYTVTENVTITIHNTDTANKVIDTVTSDGAENVTGPDLTFSESKQQDLENQARAKAIANAKQKAQTMADAAGIHLGKLTKIEDGSQNNYPVIRPMMMNAAGNAKSAPTQINPGQNNISASVTLTYETY